MSTASLSDGAAGRASTVASFPAIGTSLWPTGLIAVLVLGCVLRLIWVGDIEYKLDESWTFAQIQQIRQGGPVPAFGMPTSQGFLNPGLSLWVFLPLAELIQAQSPTDLARAIQISNVLALLGLVAFGLWIVPRAEREVWLWSAALVSVNPLAVLFQRKIWPPSVFPILIVLFLVSWWHRERRAGALCWGLIGASLGQINGPGFFFAGGFALWALLFDRKRVKWGSWFVGSCLGVVPMLSWLHYMLTDPHRLPVRRLISNALEGKFWIRWTLEPLGFGLDYSLEDDFFDFL
ncbi:MAG TPA: hypothetical protein VHR72_00255, partial [Gemmataceae bacterium]|nr:hypothetical protein [Gemmataceae bacterium]